MFIYVIVNSATLKIYIGQHKGNSLKQYLQRKLSAAAHLEASGSYLFASMRKHPKDVWSIHPLVSDLQTREECNHWEKLLIKALNVQNPKVGYNICDGGEGFTGTFTDETRQKMSASHTGSKHSPESRAKMRKPKPAGHGDKVSAAMIGNTRATGHKNSLGFRHTEEHKEKMSALMLGNKYGLGIKHSEEHKAKISAALAGENNPNFGKKMSEEQKAKLAAIQTGKKCSEETKEKMRIAQQTRRAAEKVA
jgi:hypothetical protein